VPKVDILLEAVMGSQALRPGRRIHCLVRLPITHVEILLFSKFRLLA
jgi:hypothetical protein